MAVKDYKVNQVNKDNREVTVEARYLMAAAECCAHGMRAEANPMLGCIHVKVQGGRVYVESTDTFKLVRVTRDADGDDGIDLAITAKDMKPVLKAKNRVRIGGYSEAPGTVELRVVGERTTVTARVVPGEYPNFDNLLKADDKAAETYMPLLDARLLADVCKAASRAFKEPHVRFTVGGFREPVRFRCDEGGTTFEGLLMPLRDNGVAPEPKPEPKPKPEDRPAETGHDPEPEAPKSRAVLKPKAKAAKPKASKPKAAPKPKAKAASKSTKKAVRKVAAPKPKAEPKAEPKPKAKPKAPTFGWLDRPAA